MVLAVGVTVTRPAGLQDSLVCSAVIAIGMVAQVTLACSLAMVSPFGTNNIFLTTNNLADALANSNLAVIWSNSPISSHPLTGVSSGFRQ